MSDKIAIIIPAYNEGVNLPNILKELRMWRQTDFHNRPIIVINDGSKDDTDFVARKQWTEVVSSSPNNNNVGKGGAFKIGVIHALTKYHPDYIVTLDADLLGLKAQQIDNLVKEIKVANVNMVVAASLEDGGRQRFWGKSGQRIFKAASLCPIVNGNQKWLMMLDRYGLEKALEYLIPKKKLSEELFFAQRPYRHAKAPQQQIEDFAKVSQIIQERKKRANTLKSEKVKLRQQKK